MSNSSPQAQQQNAAYAQMLQLVKFNGQQQQQQQSTVNVGSVGISLASRYSTTMSGGVGVSSYYTSARTSSPQVTSGSSFSQQISSPVHVQTVSRVQQSNSSQSQPTTVPTATPQPNDVKLKSLPFFDIHSELLPGSALVSQGSSRFQEVNLKFTFNPEQATKIAINRDYRVGAKLEYQYQVQLRFCLLDPSIEQGDEFPPSIAVQVNGKMCPLPNPIPTNKPNTEPKRPPKPVNITPLCKLNPTLANTVNVKWAAECGKGWMAVIGLVEQLSSQQLLERLNSKGKRQPEFTRDLIKKKLADDEDGIATTNLKVTLSCPLGKMRMTMPCRPSTCDHLQCFDAAIFLMMNEKKPTWICPVCDSPAKYEDLMVDGYFQEVLKAKELPEDENEIILNQDGSWNPLPKDDEEERKKKEKEAAEKNGEVLVDLSDDEDSDKVSSRLLKKEPEDLGMTSLSMSTPPPASFNTSSIECIDLD